MKKIYTILIIVVAIIAALYVTIRYGFLRTEDYKPDNSKARSALDLRSSIIAKMQQLVKDGSSGLYRLSVEQVEPHLASSSLEVINASIIPDSAIIKKLDGLQQLPDDIFKVSFSELQVEGINIDDLLSTDKLSLSKVRINKPVIEVYHQKRKYNQAARDSLTLYQKLLNSFKKIAVSTIEIEDGTFISHNINKGKHNQVDHVAIIMNDVLIDSSTQHDKTRKLFAKKLDLTVNNYTANSPDNLYSIKFGSINISGVEDKLTALRVEIHPILSKQQFQQQFTTRKEIFNISIPGISLTGIDWWLLFNEGALSANEALVENGRCSVYLNRSLPFRKVKQNDFPHQMLMEIPVPIAISKLIMRNAQLTYTEFNPAMGKTGNIIVDKMNGQLTNITNMPARISKNKTMTINSSGLFMRRIPLTMGFQFNLAKYKTGDFSMNLQIKNIDSSILNPITAPMAEFILKKGNIQKGTAYVTGNNFKTHGQGELLYTDLYLVAVKKDEDKPGNIDKKSTLSFLANNVLIKNNNPSKDEVPRRVDFDFTREPKLTFFSLVWKTIFIGILKTIGLPESFADKSY
ncbi:MAG: hypothetical protein ABIO79_00130 [Ferruginibacter sp.]